MENNMSAFRSVLRSGLTLLALAALAVVSVPVASQADTGSVRLVVTKAGFILGVGGGSGTLNFQGKRYALSLGGVSFGATIGASQTEFVGRARNMRRPSDIAGTYSAIGAGAAVAAGAGVVTLQNSNGVVLELQGRKVGLEASVAISGLTISMR
jgi:hypothetical protein